MKNYKTESEGDAKFDSIVKKMSRKKGMVLCFGRISIGFKCGKFFFKLINK